MKHPDAPIWVILRQTVYQYQAVSYGALNDKEYLLNEGYEEHKLEALFDFVEAHLNILIELLLHRIDEPELIGQTVKENIYYQNCYHELQDENFDWSDLVVLLEHLTDLEEALQETDLQDDQSETPFVYLIQACACGILDIFLPSFTEQNLITPAVTALINKISGYKTPEFLDSLQQYTSQCGEVFEGEAPSPYIPDEATASYVHVLTSSFKNYFDRYKKELCAKFPNYALFEIYTVLPSIIKTTEKIIYSYFNNHYKNIESPIDYRLLSALDKLPSLLFKNGVPELELECINESDCITIINKEIKNTYPKT